MSTTSLEYLPGGCWLKVSVQLILREQRLLQTTTKWYSGRINHSLIIDVQCIFNFSNWFDTELVVCLTYTVLTYRLFEQQA